MSFPSILKDLIDVSGCGIASAIMGFDGLAVAKYVSQSVEYDVETVGIEYGKVLDEIKNASSILSLGEVEEVVVTTLGTDVILRTINDDYFIAFAVARGANVGKARYHLRKAAYQVRRELLV